MHENLRKSDTSRPSGNSQIGNKASSVDSLEARETGQIPEALKDWRNKLLASGPDRGVSFEVEFRSKLIVRAFIGGAYTSGRNLILVLRCPLRDSNDLYACEELLDHYFHAWEAMQ